MLEKWPDYFNFFKAIDNYLVIPYSLYTITYSCYYGVYEIYDLLQEYIMFAYEVRILWFNLGYNFGGLVTAIKNIWMWSVATEYTRISDSFTMGMEMGQIFWMIFYPCEMYLDQSLANPNTEWGQDYTWDAIIYRRDITKGNYENRRTPISELPGLVDLGQQSKKQDVAPEILADTVSGNIAGFFAKHIPFFKTKEEVSQPERPVHSVVKPKMDEIRERNINDNNKPWHLVFLSGLANRFFE